MILPLNKLVDERFIPIKYIGEGGMGEIYEANDIYCHKVVALKIIKDEFYDDIFALENFKNEARFASNFNHPHIIKIYNVGEHKKHFFISYELLKGKTLKDYLDERGYLSTDVALNCILQVLNATKHIHNRKVIHNDIKPENLFLSLDGNIKLIDFGIATHIGERPEKTNASISYAAPEVLKNGYYSIQSDIYSIGMVLFELLTGKQPFTGTSEEIKDAHINQDVPSLGKLVKFIDIKAIDKIIKKATNRVLNLRYKCDEDMISDIQELLKEGEEIKKKNFFKKIFKK